MSLAKRWCFTLNNPSDEERFFHAINGESISADPEDSEFSYYVFGQETGDSGTPHLQGYFILRQKRRLAQIKALPGLSRAHLEVARGSPKQASDYCKKDGAFSEFGVLPAGPGNASSFEALREWVKAQDPAPTLTDVWEVFPSLAGRYPRAVSDCISRFGKRPELVVGALRPWQLGLDGTVNEEADDRKVIFVVDEEGNKGKSWLTRYWLTKREGTQFMSIGKRDDLAFAVNVTSDLFVFDIPRGHMEFVQYGIFEMLKNRVVFSTKYQSTTKILLKTPHVVVFCNEEPDMTKLTEDRYEILNLGNL
jgi:hypothetical protein